MTTKFDSEDLLVLARRGALSRQQQEQLTESLGESEELRTLYLAGLGFDEEDLLQPGDAELSDRINEKVVARALASSGAGKEFERDMVLARTAFDEDAAATPDDADIADRVSERVLGKRAPRLVIKRARRRVTWAGVGIFLASAVSAAAVGYPLMRVAGLIEAGSTVSKEAPEEDSASRGRRRRAVSPTGDEAHKHASPDDEAIALDEENLEDEASEPVSDSRRAEEAQLAVASPGEAPSNSAKNEPPARALESARRGYAPTSSSSPVTRDAPPTDSPKVLFERANAARRAGRVQEALEHYHALEQQFPGSRQASAALLPAAELLLRAGRASEARARFVRYRGPLMPEALWGQARSLRALGRFDEERELLLQLKDRYPESAYAQTIQRRLQAESEAPSHP